MGNLCSAPPEKEEKETPTRVGTRGDVPEPTGEQRILEEDIKLDVEIARRCRVVEM